MNKRSVEIEFRIDKHGKRRAYRWDMRQQRYFPMGLALADAMIASGEATEYIPTKPVAPKPVRVPPFPMQFATPLVA
jgi:hypothetical protein